MEKISYNVGIIAGAVTTDTTILTSETTLLTITDQKYFEKSQLTAYYDIVLGSATQVKIRYYLTPDSGSTWYQVPIKNTATGLLSDIPTLVDSTSPTQTSDIRVIEDLPFSGAFQLKITGIASGANATLKKLYVIGRDN